MIQHDQRVNAPVRSVVACWRQTPRRRHHPVQNPAPSPGAIPEVMFQEAGSQEWRRATEYVPPCRRIIHGNFPVSRSKALLTRDALHKAVCIRDSAGPIAGPLLRQEAVGDRGTTWSGDSTGSYYPFGENKSSPPPTSASTTSPCGNRPELWEVPAPGGAGRALGTPHKHQSGRRITATLQFGRMGRKDYEQLRADGLCGCANRRKLAGNKRIDLGPHRQF